MRCANILTPQGFSRFQTDQEQTYCLLDYNLVTIHLSIITFINLTLLKIQFVCHAVSMNKTLLTANVL